MNEAVIDAYMAYRTETTALAVDVGAAGDRASLERSRGIEGWPRRRSWSRPLRRRKDLPGTTSRRE